MNDARREQIDGAIGELYGIMSLVENIGADENEYFLRMAENLRKSAKGKDSRARVNHIKRSIKLIDDAIDELSVAMLKGTVHS